MGNSLNLIEIEQEQALTLSKFFIRSHQNLFLFGRRGVGKMLDLDVELPTPNGFVKLKNLKEGDQLFDEQGNICNVIKLHPINLLPISYQIVFDDHTTVNACEDHLWTTWDKRARKSYAQSKNSTIHPQVRTTKEIFNSLKVGSKQESNHSIICSKPINYLNQNLIIDPYVLGCWLGDGRTDNGIIECADSDILNEILKSGYSITKINRIDKNKSKSYPYRIGDLCKTKFGKIGLLKKQLTQLNLLKNKHIPDSYLNSSYKQRLSLLQGLMDTDGCCNKNGHIEYCSVLPILAKQVLELMCSLGIKATLIKNKSFLYGKRCKDRYRIHCITKLPIFRLSRKLINLKKTTAQDTRNTHRYIVDVKKIDPIPMRCITVDSASHLFLITRSFIPTHNTSIIFQAAKECGIKVNYINLSVIERPDLAGYPDMNAPGDVVNYKSPVFLPKLLDGAKPDSIILFDEVDKAPPEVTAPLLEILQFKRVNNKSINVASCFLTSNLINEGAHSNLISSALLDRGAKYILSFNLENWIDWAKTNSVNDLILGFLRSNPEFACGKVEDSCYASPSPRGWTLASEALNKAREYKIADIETVSQIISGFVGGEAGLRFKIWYEHYRKFEPFINSLIETGSMIFDFEKLVPTEKVVFVISACYAAKLKLFAEPTKSKNRFIFLENLCKFFTAYQVDTELQIMGLYNAFSFEMISKHKLYSCKEFFDLFTKLNESVQIKK